MSETTIHLPVDDAALAAARAVCERQGITLESAVLQFVNDIARLDRLPWDEPEHATLVTTNAAEQLSALMNDPSTPGIEPSASKMLKHLM